MTGLRRILGHNATDPSCFTESAVLIVIELVSVNVLFMDASLQHSTAGLAQRCRAVPTEVTGRLLDAAVGSFARHGFAGARVSEIARRAGLTTGAIYARWPSKADLLAAAVDHALCAILPARRLNDLDAAPMRPHDLIAMFSMGDAGADQARDVTIQAAGSAQYHLRQFTADSGAVRVATGTADSSYESSTQSQYRFRLCSSHDGMVHFLFCVWLEIWGHLPWQPARSRWSPPGDPISRESAQMTTGACSGCWRIVATN